MLHQPFVFFYLIAVKVLGRYLGSLAFILLESYMSDSFELITDVHRRDQ